MAFLQLHYQIRSEMRILFQTTKPLFKKTKKKKKGNRYENEININRINWNWKQSFRNNKIKIKGNKKEKESRWNTSGSPEEDLTEESGTQEDSTSSSSSSSPFSLFSSFRVQYDYVYVGKMFIPGLLWASWKWTPPFSIYRHPIFTNFFYTMKCNFL